MKAVSLDDAWGPLERLLLWAITPGAHRRDERDGSYIDLYTLVFGVCLGSDSPAVALRRRIGLLFAVHCRSVADLLSRCVVLREAAGKKLVVVAPDSDLPRKKELLAALGHKLSSVDASADQIMGVYKELWDVYKEGLRTLWGIFTPLDKALFADPAIGNSALHQSTYTHPAGPSADSTDTAIPHHETRHNSHTTNRTSHRRRETLVSARDGDASLPDAESPLAQIGLTAWKTHVLDKLGPHLVDLALSSVQQSRENRGQRISFPDHIPTTSHQNPHGQSIPQTFNDLANIDAIVDSCVTIGRAEAFTAAISDPASSFSTSVSLLGRFWGEEEITRHLDRFKEDIDAPVYAEHDPETLKLYSALFEKLYLDQATRFYHHEAQVLIDRLSTKDYVAWVTGKILRAETEHAARYLHPQSLSKLVTILDKALVCDHVEPLTAGIQEMLADGDNAIPDLAALFSILSRVPSGTKPCADRCRAFVEAEGDRITQPFRRGGGQGSQDESSFVEAFSNVYEKNRRIIEMAFSNEPTILLALDQACSRFVNAVRFAPELVARYSHSLMDRDGPTRRRITAGSLTQDEQQLAIEQAMEKVTRTFRYLNEKDIFEKLFASKLAKRLLYGTSSSLAEELMLLNLLKERCGPEYVTHLQRMFTDITVSQEESSAYRESGQTSDSVIHFCAHLLSTSAWPLSPPLVCRRTGEPGSSASEERATQPDWNEASPLVLARLSSAAAYDQITRQAQLVCMPTEVATFEDKFSAFYSSRHEGRKLTWLLTLARVEIKAKFQAPRPVIIEATVLQASLLYLFNDVDCWTVSDIQEKLNLGKEFSHYLELVLDLLVESELLLQTGRDTLRVNDSFRVSNKQHSCLQLVGSVPVGLLQEKLISGRDHSRLLDLDEFSMSPGELTGQDVAEDANQRYTALRRAAEHSRRTQLQAIIVRIMKQNGEICQIRLVSEVVDRVAKLGLGWEVSAAAINKNVEVLIEREYMERSPTDKTMYQYLA